jgi:hypothetical protein
VTIEGVGLIAGRTGENAHLDLGTGNGNERQAEKAEEKSSFYYIHTIAIYTLIK